MMKIRLLLLSLFCVAAYSGKAQDVAVKTNLVDDALLDVNLGVEVGVAPKWTVELPVSFNAWNMSHGRRWKHWLAQPAVRYWFCDRFAGHFVGAQLHGGQYNIGGFDGKWNLFGTDARKLKNPVTAAARITISMSAAAKTGILSENPIISRLAKSCITRYTALTLIIGKSYILSFISA